MRKLLVIADDFTGALDTGVKCAGAGLQTDVIVDGAQFHAGEAGDGDVLVLNLPTRHCDRDEAYRAVFAAVRALGSNAEIVMKKTDSALRGNIGAELAAALDASGERALAFLPAFPEIGRTTRKGVQYAGGRPIHESAFGRDPFEPVKRSDVCGVLREQMQTPARSFPAEACLPDGFSGIAVFDAESDAQLRDTVARLLEGGRLRLVAGCAGLGAALADRLSASGRCERQEATFRKFTVLCGSVSPMAARQVACAEANGAYVLPLGGGEQRDASFCESEAYREQLAALCARADAGQPTVVASRGWTEAEGADGRAAGARFADMLGAVGQDLLERREDGALLVVGGDTLLALMRRLHVGRIEPQRELAPGVVLSYIQYRGRKREILSKAGSFGTEDLFLRLWEQAAE